MRPLGQAPRRQWASTIDCALRVHTPAARDAFRCVVCVGSVQLWPAHAGADLDAHHFACNQCGAHGIVLFER